MSHVLWMDLQDRGRWVSMSESRFCSTNGTILADSAQASCRRLQEGREQQVRDLQ
jgi:hypothetical protein